jgi:hypothetical protein
MVKAIDIKHQGVEEQLHAAKGRHLMQAQTVSKGRVAARSAVKRRVDCHE